MNRIKTDYKRLDSMKDKDIDYSDVEELDGEFWAKAKLVVPQPEVKEKKPNSVDPQFPRSL